MALVHVLDISQRVAQRCTGVPNGTLQRAMIDATRKLLRESRWYQTDVMGATAIGTRGYSLGSDPYEEIVGIKAVSITQTNGVVVPVYIGDASGWRPDGGTGLPRGYIYVPEGEIAVNPIPDKVYSMTVKVILIPKQGQNQVEERVLAKWDQAIQAGALAYLLTLNEPWKDPNEAKVQEGIFRAGISNAKADEQRGFQAGSQVARSMRIF